MNNQFRQLAPDIQRTVLKTFTDESLQTVFGLTADELLCRGSLVEEAEDQDDGEEDDELAEFLLKEYDNIAKAHFDTGTAITHFFQFYLLIIGLPISAFGVVSKLGGERLDLDGFLSTSWGAIVATVAGIIAWVGVCMMGYLINLRLDGLFYARAVNGVRKYFWQHCSTLSVVEETGIRALPRSTAAPRYWEMPFFLWVVSAFIAFDALYWFVFVWYWTLRWTPPWSVPVALVGTAAFAGGHLLIYYWLADYREHGYLRKYVIGVDIDGVLNDHRTQFCNILAHETGKELDPATIGRIPVHECTTLCNMQGQQIVVSQDEETLVFNRVAYWRDMPVAGAPVGAAARICRELREAYHFRVMIFTHRPWPNPTTYAQASASHAGWSDQQKAEKIRSFQSEWGAVARFSDKRPYGDAGTLWERVWNRFLERRRNTGMTALTGEWLTTNGFTYDRLVVERGNVHVADPAARFKNRFQIARHSEMRLFVEDDAVKAAKLANVCDVVYLLWQPYNATATLPANVVRVDSWNAIKSHIRDNF